MNKLKIGDTVVINDKSRYRDQGYRGYDKMIGTISSYPDDAYFSRLFDYVVQWSNGEKAHYSKKDLIPYIVSNEAMLTMYTSNEDQDFPLDTLFQRGPHDAILRR